MPYRPLLIALLLAFAALPVRAQGVIDPFTLFPAGGAEPDQYFYSSGAGSTCSGTSINAAWEPQNYAYGNDIDVAAGTATSIGVCLTTTGGIDGVRYGLYNTAGTLVASGTGDPGADGWFDITVSATVSAGTYHVMYMSNEPTGGTNFIQYGTGDAGDGCAQTLGAFPPATISTGCFGAEATANFRARICVGTC